MNEIAVIFDMDGVVVNNFPFHEKAWELFCNKYGIMLSESFKLKVFGGTNKDHLETFFKRSLSEHEVRVFEQEKEKIYREIYSPQVKPVSGLIMVLKDLKENCIPVALATSSPPVNVDFILEKTSTKKYFKTIVDASMVKKGKPHPEIYLTAAKRLKIDPSKCIVFEDSIVGIQSAISAGMMVIGLSTTLDKNEIREARQVIPDFKSVSAFWLHQLLSGN